MTGLLNVKLLHFGKPVFGSENPDYFTEEFNSIMKKHCSFYPFWDFFGLASQQKKLKQPQK
jgi:hypothetical protein